MDYNNREREQGRQHKIEAGRDLGIDIKRARKEAVHDVANKLILVQKQGKYRK